MLLCSFCNQEFNSKDELNFHQAVCGNNYSDEKDDYFHQDQEKVVKEIAKKDEFYLSESEDDPRDIFEENKEIKIHHEKKIKDNDEKIKDNENEKKKNEMIEKESQRRALGQKSMRKKLSPEVYEKKKFGLNTNIIEQEIFESMYCISILVEDGINSSKYIRNKGVRCEDFSQKIKTKEKEYKDLIEKILFQTSSGKKLVVYANQYPEILCGLKLSRDFLTSMKYEEPEYIDDKEIEEEIEEDFKL